jgi:CBS domain-containing protein
MAISQAELKSQAVESATEAFEAFCEDISGMFGVDMECSQQEESTETPKDIAKKFKKFSATNTIEAEGDLSGTFQMVFDKDGLFTLAGVIVMLPEQRILENRKTGTEKDAREVSDAIGEVGNLLVGSWDRIFRENLDGHKHFKQTETIIGTPWKTPQEKLQLADDQKLLYIPYEMTIGKYEPFNCAVIFPETIFSAETAAAPVEEPKAEKEPAPVEEPKAEEEPAPVEEPKAEEEPAPAEEPKAEEEPAPVEEPKAEEEPAPVEEPKAEEESAPAEEPAEAEQAQAPEETPVSESIQQITDSPAELPGSDALASLSMCAADVMQTDLLWGTPEDSVEQALEKMQQTDTGYMLIGTEGTIEGIVSAFDIASAVSIYLRPMFEKWRRPIDDATLQIRVKWIMARPVRTIKAETPITAIMDYMSRSAVNCMPVLGTDGKAAGIVTTFDIFNALSAAPGTATAGKTTQAPAMA